MPSTNTTDTQGLSAQAQVPAERIFQIDPSGLGGIAQNVNLFRGDVSVPITLVSLSSRSGIDASLALIYNSNTGEHVDTWNLEAPTGPVGLGWSLGYEFIARDPGLAARPIDGVYYLVAGGSSNRLFRTAVTASFWEFEAEAFLFWRIRYYPLEEQWELVQEDGTRRLYGGRGAGDDDSAIQYGIKWEGAEGNWTDATVVTSGQSRYVVAWNLTTIAPIWGDDVQMEYESAVATIGSSTGMSYTVSSRLKRVVVPMVRTLIFHYLPKSYDDTAREYQIPHFDLNSPELHAYQDRYETHYLDAVEVRNADDAASAPNALIQRVGFEYALVNMSLAHQGDADYVKRYLAAVTYTTPEGLPMPNMRFDYFDDPARDLDEGVNRGALRSILYPPGGRINYAYKPTPLAGTDRSTAITSRGTPRVWFGPDYTVLVNHDGEQRGLTVRVYSWNGLWIEAPNTYHLAYDIDLATLDVSVQPEFFALGCRTAGTSPQFLVLLFHKQKGRYGQWITDQDFTTLPLQGGDQALLATGSDFAVALTSGPYVMARVWNERGSNWADESGAFQVPSHASYALAASADYVTLASSDGNGRVGLRISYRTREGTGFTAAHIDHETLVGVDWRAESTPQTFWSLGTRFASMTYVTGRDDKSIRYAVKVLQWDDSFYARTVFDEAYSIDAETNLPYAQSVVSGSVLGNVSNLFRYDGRSWQRGTLPTLDASGEPPRFVYGNDVAVISGMTSAAIASFDPYQPKWNAAIEITESGLGFTPTAHGDYVSVDRQVYYRHPSNTLTPVYQLDSNLVAQSLVNRAPYFFAYEDQSGNTHVLPLANGTVDAAAEIVLKNERIHVPDGDSGTTLVGPSSLMTYQGSFDSPSALKLYQFVKHGIEGRVSCYPVQSLSIDDGYPDEWGGVWSAASKSSSFYYDCENVTVTPDGSVTEFAAATTVYGLRNGGSVAYPPPAATAFGCSEYRYHNNRTPRASGLVPSDEMLDPSAVYYYSYLNGMLFDQTDYDAASVPVERTYNLYEVRTEVASVDDAETRVRLIGGYVKRPRTEISQYEQAIDVVIVGGDAPPAGARVHSVPVGLRQALIARGVVMKPQAALVADRTGRQWHLYPDPAAPRYLPVTIEGNTLTASVAVTRGVGSEFSWQTGLLTSDYTENHNGHGKHEVLSRRVYRAWEVGAYAALKDAHVWAPVAVSIKYWAEDGMLAPGEPQVISINTWAQWGEEGEEHWAPRRNFVAASAAAYDASRPIPVNFDGWDDASLPATDLWRLSGEVARRDSGGSAVEALDAFGRPTATLLNRCGTARIAEFSNATLAEALFTGFETYEDLDRWRLNGQPLPDGLLTRGDAHTGSRALSVPVDASQQFVTALTLVGGNTYILSCWVKTPVGFDAVAGQAQWSLAVAGEPMLAVDVIGTNGTWAYQHWPVQLPPAAQRYAVSLRLCNGKTGAGGSFLLDDVMFAPLVGSASASVYEERYGAEVAAVTLSGNTTRTFFDSRQRVAARTGVNEDIVGGSITQLVRENQINPDFKFAPEDPNSVVSVEAAGGGSYANLVQGDGWKSQWDTGPSPDAWQVTDGVLTHVGGDTDTVDFRSSSDLTDYGVRVTVHLPVGCAGEPIPPTQPVGLDIGTDLGVRWEPGTGWHLTLAGTVHDLGAAPFAHDWALFAPIDPVSGKRSVHFYADGRLLYARVDTPAVRGTTALTAGDPGIGFSAVAVFVAPMLSAVFLDGSGKERQQQSFAGDGSIVSGSLYDPIGRAAIGVKPAAAPDRGLAYDDDYVLTFDPASGVMTGRAASAYPEDEGYPYVRTEFVRTAQSLVAMQGAPGKSLAIAYTGDAPAPIDANPHVQHFSYGTNVEGQFGGDNWPSNQYFVTKIVDPNGVPSYTLTSQTDETLAALGSPGDGTLAITQYYYDGNGRLVKTLPPAGVDAQRAGDPNADQWASTTIYNFLGEAIEARDPDAGLTRSVFGLGGQLRFVAGADEADGLATIRYVKYDAIGREAESGTLRRSWDRAELERIAVEDPAWPGPTQSPVVSMLKIYDGHGDDPTQFGQLIRSTAYATRTNSQVEQRYNYDTSGLLVRTTQTASAYDAHPRVVSYGYNAIGGLVSVAYPDASALPEVTYAYDRLGQIYQVGTPQDPSAIASYGYNAAGQVERSVVNLSEAAQLLSIAQYGPPGWLLESSTTRSGVDAAVLQENLSYTQGGYQGAGYYDGKIASVQFADGDGSQTYAYAYDGLSRLRVAERSEGGVSSTDVALSYDVNGNIQSLQADGASSTYSYVPHTDRVDTVASGGTTIDAFRYDEQGAATSARRRGLTDIAYDPATGLTEQITLQSGESVILGYDGEQARTVKQLTDASGAEASAKLYVRDQSGSPLVEVSRSAGGPDDERQYLYGPSGLIGMRASGKRYAVVRDHLGSVRCVVDETGAVVARYDYSSFGVTVTRPGATQPDILYYRYTGQEFDPETELYNYQARMYDPELGRFIAVDPQRQGASPYVYVLNNPIGLVDPDGEEALTAFLIAVIVSAIIGAVAGAVTYAVTHQGNFEVGGFFLYAAAGLVAGAAGGAAAFGGGLLATAALGAIGVSTSTSIASGIVVGAVAGAADGAVAGALNQVGVNLIEGRPAGEGVGEAAWMGAAIGGAAGAVLGGAAGAINYRTASRLRNPTRVITNRRSGLKYANTKGATTYAYNQIGNAAAGTGPDDVIGMVAHGRSNARTLRFTDQDVAGTARGGARQDVADVVADLNGSNAGGVDLSRVCHAGSSGVARTLANDLNVPVRAATGTTRGAGRARTYFGRSLQRGEGYITVQRSLMGVTYRTYYPSQLRTGWNYLFGY